MISAPYKMVSLNIFDAQDWSLLYQSAPFVHKKEPKGFDLLQKSFMDQEGKTQFQTHLPPLPTKPSQSSSAKLQIPTKPYLGMMQVK